MTYFTLSPNDRSLTQALTVRLHESLVRGLRSTGAFTGDRLTAADAAKLAAWADQCENPDGQKATLARMVAAVVVFGNGATLSPASAQIPPTGFWGAV